MRARDALDRYRRLSVDGLRASICPMPNARDDDGVAPEKPGAGGHDAFATNIGFRRRRACYGQFGQV